MLTIKRVSLFVCVCVCLRERERERESRILKDIEIGKRERCKLRSNRKVKNVTAD